jgi:uncharacterized protein DUF955
VEQRLVTTWSPASTEDGRRLEGRVDISSRDRDTRYDLARGRARGLLTLTRQKPPIDVQAIIDLAGIPVVERVLIDGMRGTIGDVAGQRSIILNRHHRFSSEQERRWVLAEELGHVLLAHQLVESTAPGKPTMGLLEERRILYEREARAFAAELLMPFLRSGSAGSRSPRSIQSRAN